MFNIFKKIKNPFKQNKKDISKTSQSLKPHDIHEYHDFKKYQMYVREVDNLHHNRIGFGNGHIMM